MQGTYMDPVHEGPKGTVPAKLFWICVVIRSCDFDYDHLDVPEFHTSDPGSGNANSLSGLCVAGINDLGNIHCVGQSAAGFVPGWPGSFHET